MTPSRELRIASDRVVDLILAPAIPLETVQREMAAVRSWCRRELPDRLTLFDIVYLARWTRLIEQFRN